MSGTKPAFQLIGDDGPPAPAATVPGTPITEREQAARALLFTALRSLSQRSLTAITNLFSLILVASVAWLLAGVLASPSLNQLAGVGGYAVFCLLIDIIRRKNK